MVIVTNKQRQNTITTTGGGVGGVGGVVAFRGLDGRMNCYDHNQKGYGRLLLLLLLLLSQRLLASCVGLLVVGCCYYSYLVSLLLLFVVGLVVGSLLLLLINLEGKHSHSFSMMFTAST